MFNPKINVLVLNWNGEAILNNCIKSILKSKYDNYCITIIDNGSSDNALNNLLKDERISVIKIDKNIGYSQGYNYAFKKIKDNKDDFYLLLNNDTILNEDSINSLVNSMRTYGSNNIYGPKILNYNNERNWFCGGEICIVNGLPYHEGINSIDSCNIYKTREVYYISGCCMLINKELISNLKGFDTKYKMYFEDVDLCVRAKMYGSKSYYVSDSSIHHLVSFSLGGSFSFSKYIIKIISFIKFLFTNNNIILFVCYLFMNLLLTPLYIMYYIKKKIL